MPVGVPLLRMLEDGHLPVLDRLRRQPLLAHHGRVVQEDRLLLPPVSVPHSCWRWLGLQVGLEEPEILRVGLEGDDPTSLCQHPGAESANVAPDV